MSLENTTEDGDKTLFLQQEASRSSSFLDDFPKSISVLVVDSNFITLLNMKKIMKQLAYQVTIYANAEEAMAFLTTCKHDIDIVMWDFHMPGINGLQALKIIGSKLNLPVVKSVMNATIHGACDYVMKPVRETIIANIWQHIVRQRMMSKPGLIPPVRLDLVHNDGLQEEKDDSMTVVDQGNSEQNIDMTEEKEPRLTRTGEIQPIQSDLVQSDGSNPDNDGSNPDNDGSRTVSHIDKQNERKSKKPRMSWTKELQEKFVQAIDIVGGPQKANPKLLLKCLKDMKIEGLNRGIVSSHLQKHRLSLAENQIPQQTQEIDLSSACIPSPLYGLNNGLTPTSSVMNGPAVYPVQENQYQNGFSALLNNNQIITNTMPRLPYFNHDHHLLQQLQQQQYQPPHQLNNMMTTNEPEQAYQLNNMMRTNEPEQASGIDLTDLEPFFSTLLDDPDEFVNNGCNFNQ